MSKRGAVYVPPLSIENLFDQEELADLLALARRRIVKEFIEATEVTRSKKRRSTGGVIYAEDHPQRLSHYVTLRCRGIVSPKALPEGANPRTLSPRAREEMAKALDAQLITTVILQMKEDNDLWYNEMGCYWSIPVTQVDLYHEEADRARRRKNDRRNEHGQVRSQRKRRGRMAGSSVAMTGPGSSSQAA